MKKGHASPNIGWTIFVLALCFLMFSLGVGVGHFQFFPYSFYKRAGEGYAELKKQRLRTGELTDDIDLDLIWYYRTISRAPVIQNQPIYELEDGVNLITRVAEHLNLDVDLRDMNGKVLHQWQVNWFDVWPEATHLPPYVVPQSPPGTHILGTVLLPNGNLVFNYQHLGTVCLDPSSRVIWKLPYRTHHSINLDDDGNLWMCAQKTHTKPAPDFPGRAVPFDEYMIIEVSTDGLILEEWSVDQLLMENGLQGLFSGRAAEENTFVCDDILHLNDAEPFPMSMEPGLFVPGDIMVSLRDVDTVFVFNRQTRKIKYVAPPGMFRHQHDPDFVDGNTFSVFDNNVKSPTEWEPDTQSRIVVVSALNNSMRVAFQGTPQKPFFSPMMGNHQWLENGHLLVTESMEGRALEIDENGHIVWEWTNRIGQNILGMVEDVHRLSKTMQDSLQPLIDSDSFYEIE